MWSILIVTLPTQPNAVRLRVWRALKALGCGALRDGAYLLPAERAELFEPLVDEVRRHRGSAELLDLQPRSARQRDALLALFDRSEAYAGWREQASALHRELAAPDAAEVESRRRLRGLADGLLALQRIDYYPGPASAQAQALLDELRHDLESRFSPGEPRAAAEHRLPQLDAARFRRKRWATRARPWVDRLASAWLIRRFIDTQAEFLWLADPARLPRGAIGFDFDGARFSHVGARVTFEVLCASFALDANAALRRIGAIVHALDAGGIPVPEAAGLESVLGGLRALHADDDDLLAAASSVFDALYAAPGSKP